MITLSPEAVGSRVVVLAESHYRNSNGTIVGVSRDGEHAYIELDEPSSRGRHSRKVYQEIERQRLAWIRDNKTIPANPIDDAAVK